MNGFEILLYLFDYITSTNAKRRLAGGILLSFALMFGGFAFTVMTLNIERNDKHE